MKAEQVSVKQIIETDPVSASSGMSLSQVKHRMEQENLRALPVVDEKNRLEGVIGYRDLIRHIQFNPASTGLGKVMHQPPKLEEDMNLVEAADLRINSGRKLMVMVEDEKLKGVVGEREFSSILSQIEELETINSRDMATDSLKTVEESDSLEKARHMMLDNNISRLPVTDQHGNYVGILRSTDMLRMIVPRESQSSGGTSGGRKQSEVSISGGSEKERMSEIPVSELMSYETFSMDEHVSGKEAASKLNESKGSEIVFVDDRVPESILTVKDFIDYLADFAPGNTVLVNLVGLELPEEKAAVHEKIKTQLRGSLGRKLERPEELTVRFKKSEKNGTNHRWEIDMKLYSEFGIITINEEGWEMIEAVDQALEEMDSIVRKKKDKRKDH